MIVLTTTNYTDRSVTFSVDGVRYEYFMETDTKLEAVAWVARKSEAKALNVAKRNALRWQRLESKENLP